MADWLRNCLLYEINTWVWLRDWEQKLGRPAMLQDLPAAAWDSVEELGAEVVWLMGVWERSPAGVALGRKDRRLMAEMRHKLPDLHRDDFVGSPYAVRRYEVDAHLGGSAGLAAAREALAHRGIRLLLDFVPNHLAIDHPWVSAQPEWFVRGTEAERGRAPNAFLKVGDQVFARGRDPYFPPWSDVLQLNVFNPECRKAAAAELKRIADQCDGVRCDMAMLVVNEVFARTWGERAGPPPQLEYWAELIPAIRASCPEFKFLVEAYWDFELKLFELGIDACYDKTFYDRLAHGDAASIRAHLGRFAAKQDRMVRFLENHDEPRAAAVFPDHKAVAAAVVLLTLPGVRLLHDGQLEGRKVRTAVHLGRRCAEPANGPLQQAYARLLKLAAQPAFRVGEWTLCPTTGWPDNNTHEQLLAWCWRTSGEQWLIVVNYSALPAQGRLQIPWTGLAGTRWRLADRWTAEIFERGGDEVSSGLYVGLEPWAAHMFEVETLDGK